MIDLGLKIHLPKSCFGIVFSLKSEDADFGNVEKHLVFIAYSPHCFAKSKLRKTIKKLHNAMTTDRLTKPPKSENINISMDNCQIHV